LKRYSDMQVRKAILLHFPFVSSFYTPAFMNSYLKPIGSSTGALHMGFNVLETLQLLADTEWGTFCKEALMT
jgi:hypothetical protein